MSPSPTQPSRPASGLEPIDGVVLDHVAHAVAKWQEAWSRYAVDLGAEWSSGGEGPGFAPAQLRFANGAKIEVLMPCHPELNDFLVRFLDRSGPGPHHLTFKVADLEAAIDTARAGGWEPIGIDLSDPDWMEAFLHPKDATGVVVQLAQAPVAWSSDPPSDYPVGRRQRIDGSGPAAAASLVRVVHAVADFDEGVRLFEGLLGGRRVAAGTVADQQWADYAWGSPLGIRVVAPLRLARRPTSRLRPSRLPVATLPIPALSQWIGSRTGRLHHLELVAPEPWTIPEAEPFEATSSDIPSSEPAVSATGGHGRPDTGPWVVEPAGNNGLRLVVLPAGEAT